MKIKKAQRNLNRLRDHPSQAELFQDLSEAELDALADDIRRNGLRQPVEICSDGTIIAGHQRVRAATRLGWKRIDVMVREDLEEMGSDAIEQRLVEDNLNRRQLDPLMIARCIAVLMKQYKQDRRLWDPTSRQELRDVIGKRFGLSGREASRYLRVLETPMAVQQAFSRGELSLVTAGKVAGLKEEDQKEIAARLGAGEKAGDIVDSFLKKMPRRHSYWKQYAKFFFELSKLLDLIPPADELSKNSASKRHVALLKTTINVFRTMLKWETAALRTQAPESDEDLAELRAKMQEAAQCHIL